MRILLTGASRGIGRAMAERLAGPGVAIGLCATKASREHDEAVTACRARGAHAEALVGDLGDSTVPAALVSQTVAAFGGLDAVVSNAGIMLAGSLAEIDEEAWDRTFAVNVRGAWLLARAAHPHLAATDGAFVAVASTSGVQPYPGGGAYSPSKAALLMLVQTLAQEWAASGARANAVSPGLFLSDMTAAIYADPSRRAAREALVPLRRIGDAAADLAGVVAFLISPAARYITGQNIVVDGGFLGSIQAHLAGRPKAGAA
ncbi:SDR family oxidoreductase [Xanthobacter dioxanivorans]|uniref:SDR family oxidoreductase n=1 Tax=Xanthobacter dioxanivorans TaxID=2528964 RepID=A0A974PSR7_9HYPH|nr:SDR family oxidoreductase [Xanthobacter dioxanivorans]QRG09030.1 SDR family oxidoreductase [Xanthobacter dioxanivorans]